MTVRTADKQRKTTRTPALVAQPTSSHAATGRISWVRVRAAAERLYRASPVERISIVREGVPAGFVEKLSEAMEMSKERMYSTVGLPRATVDRKISADERLSPGQSERVVGLTQLIGLAHAMVEESGDAKGFDAAVWVSDWLDQPHPALGGAKPGEFMDTAEGCTLVSNLLAQQQSGAYA